MKIGYGFTLLTILIFLNIFSLLSLFALMQAATEMKKNNHAWQMHLIKLKAKKRLAQIENNEDNFRHCMITIRSPKTLSKKPLFWWQKHACYLNENNYYVVESLGIDACALITLNGQAKPAHYYRVTLFVLSAKLGAKYCLQSTVAKPDNSTMACQNKLHRIKQGRQMYREI